MRSVPWPPLARLALAILVLLAGLGAVVPGAEAQIRIGGSFDNSYGWTFPDGDDHPGAALDDATGDVVLQTDDAEAVPVGSVPAYGAFDLVQARLDEPDQETLRLIIQVADLDAQRIVAEHVFSGIRYETSFTLAGDSYRVRTFVWIGCAPDADPCLPYVDPVVTAESALYEVSADGIRPIGFAPSRAVSALDRIEVLLPRWSLDGPGAATAPLAGNEVTAFQVRSEGGTICIMACARMSDLLPDGEPAPSLHVLTLDSNGAEVRFVDGRGPAKDEDGDPVLRPLAPRALTIDIAPGGVAQVPLRVQNAMGTKTLVLTQAEVVSAHAATVHVAKSLEVPGGTARKLILTVNQTTAIPVDDPLVVRVGLEGVGARSVVDTLLLRLRTIPPLDADNPRLYLHTISEGQDFFSELGVDQFAYSQAVLNTLADDPADNGRGTVVSDFCFCINRPYMWSTTSGLLHPVELDNGTEAIVHVEIDAPVAGTLFLSPAVFYGDEAVADAETEVPLQQGPNTIDVPLYVREDARRLEAGPDLITFTFGAIFRPADVPLAELAAIAEPLNPTLKTQGASWIELPVRDPADRFANATHLTVDLEGGSDRVRYLNPGRATLWNVTIVNQADEEDTVTLRTVAPDDWKTRIAPGRSFKLGPGEGVTVGVRATAPGDAAEDSTTKIVLEVASKLAKGDTTGIALAAVVTRGIDIAEPHYEADNETTARLADKTTTAESPLLTPLVLVPFLAALAVHLRRRSR